MLSAAKRARAHFSPKRSHPKVYCERWLRRGHRLANKQQAISPYLSRLGRTISAQQRESRYDTVQRIVIIKFIFDGTARDQLSAPNMHPPEKWYILYDRGEPHPLPGNPEPDTQWLLLLCNTEDEALALSCRLVDDAPA